MEQKETNHNRAVAHLYFLLVPEPIPTKPETEDINTSLPDPDVGFLIFVSTSFT